MNENLNLIKFQSELLCFLGDDEYVNGHAQFLQKIALKKLEKGIHIKQIVLYMYQIPEKLRGLNELRLQPISKHRQMIKIISVVFHKHSHLIMPMFRRLMVPKTIR